ncbi:hypothetical protein DEU56DRAFT_479126 [Suillus clintonianus]|uniref:uncharacterized protein n=1 Tax=Suillus clintonianus TaxID=1904413 RepID=UPI001B8700E9|nr:uncharacterized protein DEU56DRAFT_479126 [Suillus clintonianus]KAG2153323.1 hypothetical protein DEU56DRAFT_479126 [Suillus clintonianus]
MDSSSPFNFLQPDDLLDNGDLTGLHAPQPRHPLIYHWSDFMSTGSYSPMNTQTTELSISRPHVPSPILTMQDNLLSDFHDIIDSSWLSPHLPVCNCNTNRSKPYYIKHPHKHHSTYLCCWDIGGTLCGHEIQVTFKEIFAHLRQHHRIGVDNKGTYRCSWSTPHHDGGCCGKELKTESFGRHIITHIGIRIKCSVCSTTMAARNDLAARHRRECPNCSQADFMIIPGRNPQASL